MDSPDLLFGQEVSVVGFTPAGISAYSDLRAAAVVRELIQNSLDAALIETKNKSARVRFRKFTCKTDEIPGIKKYRAAFGRAVLFQGSGGKKTMPRQAQIVADRIGNALKENSQSVLSVTDNGIGLDKRRMSALLSDGISAKSGNAAGTYGNGHSVAIPASNLRYILYGGVTEGGLTLASGHAVLASHRRPRKKTLDSAHGFYIEEFGSQDEGVYYTFPEGSSIPPLIRNEVECIRDEHGHGAVVVIPAFNHFEDERSLWKIVSHAAVCNFFKAIHAGQLVVEVEDHSYGKQDSGEGPDIQILDKGNLSGTLQLYEKEARIGRRGAFLTGSKANEAFSTLVDGTLHTIKTSQGDVQVSLRLCDKGKPGVGLCRNGMWITDHLPLFQNQFHDRQPFQALILLDPGDKSEFYKLVQEAETPLHNELSLKPMSGDRRMELRDSLREILDWIRENVPEAKAESYSPDDILSVQFSGAEAKEGRGDSRQSFWGSPTTTEPRQPHQGAGQQSDLTYGPRQKNGNGTTSNRKRKEKIRRLTAPYFRVGSVPLDVDKRKMLIECNQDCDNAELRLFIDESIDATCDRQPSSQVVPLRLSNVSVNGEPVSEKCLTKENEDYVGINLGNLAANTKTVVETEFSLPDGVLGILPETPLALRMEITSRAEKTDSPSEETIKSEEVSDV